MKTLVVGGEWRGHLHRMGQRGCKRTQCFTNAFVFRAYASMVFFFYVQEYIGTLERDKVYGINISGQAGSTLDVLVENMGHINFGSNDSDIKVHLTRLL